MSKELKIFIAGAKDLNEERSCIKTLANDLSTSTGKHVIALSYEQFDDNQDSYDKYIEENADIVIFIIDKTLGSHTEDEFCLAANSYKKEKHPEVMVFLRKFKEEEITKEMAIERARITGLIKGKFDYNKYYVEYVKDDYGKGQDERLKDLKIQVEKRISRFISQNKGQSDVRPSTKNKNKNKNVYSILISITAIILGGILAWYLFFNDKKSPGNTGNLGNGYYIQDSSPLIVFAGGGSVRNFLRLKYGDSLDVMKYKHSINIGLASGSSWRVLTEEYQYKDYAEINKFITICISASEMMDTSDFYREHIGNMQDAIVGEVLLGYDTVSVIVSNDLLDHWGMTEDTSISATTLASNLLRIIEAKPGEANDARIFTTNKTSGTLDAYKSCLSNVKPSINLEDLIDNNLENLIGHDSGKKALTQEEKEDIIKEIKGKGKLSYIFYDKTEGEDIHSGYLNNHDNDKPFIILGSSYYYPEKLSPNTYKKLLLTDDDGYCQMKPMYLYFLAYKAGNSKDHYQVSRHITEYLQKLDGTITVDPSMKGRWDTLLLSNRIDYQKNECKKNIVKINKACSKTPKRK